MDLALLPLVRQHIELVEEEHTRCSGPHLSEQHPYRCFCLSEILGEEVGRSDRHEVHLRLIEGEGMGYGVGAMGC